VGRGYPGGLVCCRVLVVKWTMTAGQARETDDQKDSTQVEEAVEGRPAAREVEGLTALARKKPRDWQQGLHRLEALALVFHNAAVEMVALCWGSGRGAVGVSVGFPPHRDLIASMYSEKATLDFPSSWLAGKLMMDVLTREKKACPFARWETWTSLSLRGSWREEEGHLVMAGWLELGDMCLGLGVDGRTPV
jgi:hypothetical protein